ncbi:MAG: type II secretion system F family protein [Sediminimonas qiaohouensis]|uniref:Type II secretion system F family protein n=1 Tax=Sediminimonas qiaohouensis TaxID=552061 RepID=A0A7C9H9B0_9RHOB|nr:type II secretion system F family protein [Sediminimonas qiaohouensis]MTJ03249.1 type II secretion system F family protein [Sediminimonas qiaohouensis]
MNALNSFLDFATTGFGPVILAGALGILLILGTLPFVLTQRKDPLDKLKKSAREDKNRSEAAQTLRPSRGNEKLEKYSGFLEPKTEEEYSDVRLKLMQAGYRNKDAVRFFHFAQFALGLVGLALGTAYYLLALAGGPDVTTQTMLLYILGPGGAGYFLPRYWVTKRRQERQEQIISGFPDALDMMLVCVEAGQSLDQSIIRVAQEIRASFPALADEFEIVSYEIKAGKDKTSVLYDMAERCGVNDISSFVTVLIQSATFGTSIAEALRVYAGEMRDKRVMRAEEKANKLPTQMTLATMALTVPPLLIILIGPSVVGITKMGEMNF